MPDARWWFGHDGVEYAPLSTTLFDAAADCVTHEVNFPMVMGNKSMKYLSCRYVLVAKKATKVHCVQATG